MFKNLLTTSAKLSHGQWTTVNVRISTASGWKKTIVTSKGWLKKSFSYWTVGAIITKIDKTTTLVVITTTKTVPHRLPWFPGPTHLTSHFVTYFFFFFGDLFPVYVYLLYFTAFSGFLYVSRLMMWDPSYKQVIDSRKFIFTRENSWFASWILKSRPRVKVKKHVSQFATTDS